MVTSDYRQIAATTFLTNQCIAQTAKGLPRLSLRYLDPNTVDSLLLRPARFIRLFDVHGRRWIRHENFPLPPFCIGFTGEPLGHVTMVGNTGSKHAVIVFGFVVHVGPLAIAHTF